MTVFLSFLFFRSSVSLCCGNVTPFSCVSLIFSLPSLPPSHNLSLLAFTLYFLSPSPSPRVSFLPPSLSSSVSLRLRYFLSLPPKPRFFLHSTCYNMPLFLPSPTPLTLFVPSPLALSLPPFTNHISPSSPSHSPSLSPSNISFLL